MTSNYPPGMKESDIPGFNAADYSMHVECKNQFDAKVMNMAAVLDAETLKSRIDRIGTYLPTSAKYRKEAGRLIQTASDLLESLTQTIVPDLHCTFEGEVDGTADEGRFCWTCEVCGADNETELPEPPEPDWEAMWEAQAEAQKDYEL